MSAAHIPGPLLVRPWIDHSATTVGYMDGKKFVALADCSIGPDFAVNYEAFAHHVVKALNAHEKLVAALAKARDLCLCGGALREDFLELDEALALASGQALPTAALPVFALNPAALADAKRFAQCTSLDGESIEQGDVL